jgi:DNA invertase Pin-like site-specific DNA recombinase
MTKRKPLRIEKALCYCRVSTAAQVEGESLAVQERNLIEAAKAAGYGDIEVMREEGRSGASLKQRPVLKDARQRLKAGQASALFVAHIDRLGRNTRDVLQIHDEAEAQGWRLVVTSQNGWDTATPVGRLMLTMFAALAEMERARISERAKDLHADRRRRGIVWGVDMGSRSKLSNAVRQTILEARNRGETFRQIAAALNDRGVETPTGRGGAWYPVTVKRVIDSPQSKAIRVAA